ncbi:MAG: aminopeptidase [Bdellovibrionota bacterium]
MLSLFVNIIKNLLGARYELYLCLLLVLNLSSCYVTKLAWHQNNLFNSRQKISAVIANRKTSKDTREQLLKLIDVLNYAGKEGLNREGAYTYYIDTDKRYVSYLVQAAYPNRLEAITWWFPIVGSVPYKGFFYEDERDDEAAQLQEKGLDIYKSGVGAYSSLGWFDDPVYPSMIKRKVSSLAHLFFHELTHRTLWVADSAKFNENLAEYIGDILTEKYLLETGREKELIVYKNFKYDNEVYKKWLSGLKNDLEELYKNQKGYNNNQILLQKAEIFKEWTKGKVPKFKSVDLIRGQEWNNARVLASSLYSPDLERFNKAYQCAGSKSAGEFLERLKLEIEHADDPFTGLDSICISS